jgi:repressor LexA
MSFDIYAAWHRNRESMETLTSRQQEVLDYVTRHIEERGYPPTLREISRHIKTSGTISAQKHLEALERKGYIRRIAGSSRGIELVHSARSTSLPIVGTVQAGLPQLAVENIEGYCAIDASWVKNERCFILRVKGDSMVEAHILNGDLALIRPQQVARNGEIVVALIDGEATLKRFYREKDGSIRLQPENQALMPIIIREGEAEAVILGKLLRTVRSYD